MCCEGVGEKVEELGEPVREEKDVFRSCKVALAGGLNGRVVAIFLVSRNLYRSALCHAHYRELSCPVERDAAEPELSRDVAVRHTLDFRI